MNQMRFVLLSFILRQITEDNFIEAFNLKLANGQEQIDKLLLDYYSISNRAVTDG